MLFTVNVLCTASDIKVFPAVPVASSLDDVFVVHAGKVGGNSTQFERAVYLFIMLLYVLGRSPHVGEFIFEKQFEPFADGQRDIGKLFPDGAAGPFHHRPFPVNFFGGSGWWYKSWSLRRNILWWKWRPVSRIITRCIRWRVVISLRRLQGLLPYAGSVRVRKAG